MILTLNYDGRIFDCKLLMIYQESATQIPFYRNTICISCNAVIVEQYLKLTSGFVYHLIKKTDLNSSDLGDSNIHSSSMLLETNLSNIRSQLILLLTQLVLFQH